MNVIAVIPARMGSERLPIKNLALLNGSPLVSYAVEAAKASGVFSRVVLNSDGGIFEKVSERYGAEFYLRPQELGSSETKSDIAERKAFATLLYPIPWPRSRVTSAKAPGGMLTGRPVFMAQSTPVVPT